MTADLEGRAALITGASRGIGRAITECLHAAGAVVYPVARPSEDFEQLCEHLGQRCVAWAGDAASDACLSWIDAQERIDILVNNVGTNIPKPMGEVTDGDLDHMIDLNVRATFRISRHALARMGSPGHIVNITSQMGHVGSPKRTAYCMTKHAIEGLTKAMAVELAPRGIRVNAVAPTFVETPLTAPMLADPTFRDFVEQMIPLGKTAQPEDVAAAVAFLVGPGAEMVTGTSLRVDGGWTAQ
ncbi:MAG: SDR family oxidoreductase [Pseudomonadota bacterium]